MSISSKLQSAMAASRLTWAVLRNSGVMPASHRPMVLIEPTSVCNLACPLCPTGTGTLERQNKYIPEAMYNRIVDVTAPIAEGYILNLFGEPTFHPSFPKLLEKTRHWPTWLSTNLSYGEAMVHEMAKWKHLRIICSIDTINPGEYGTYRINGDWEKVMRNLKTLSEGVCEVHPQFLVPCDQKDDAPFLRFAERFNIPPGNIVIKRKMENFRLDYTRVPSPGICHSAYLGVYFNCDGYLLPCCNNARKDLHMLHIDDIQSHEDILNNPRVQAFRKVLARDKNAYPSCGNCAGHSFWKKQLPTYVKCLNTLLPGKRVQQGKPDRMSF